MNESERENHAFLMRQHEAACFEVGEHPLEFTTPFSAGAEAIERLSAHSDKEPKDG